MPVRYLSVPPCLLVQLRGVFLDPAVDRGVIDRHAPLKSSFPPERGSLPRSGSTTYCPQNDATGEMTTGEDTCGCDYFTSLFLLPQLCNNAVSRKCMVLKSMAAPMTPTMHNNTTARAFFVHLPVGRGLSWESSTVWLGMRCVCGVG